MEVTNTTDVDAKYKVSGSTQGSGMDPRKPVDPKDAGNWPTLPAGGRIQHKPKSPGPWIVYFVVKDEVFHKSVHPETERVALVKNGGGFRVDSN
ncbi:MAG TPA: hypothetical protein VF789_11605 [Thermoanaerobaculia bacterium]